MKTNDCNLCEKRKVCKYLEAYKDTASNIEKALDTVEECVVTEVEVKCSEYKEEPRLTIQEMSELLKNINKNIDFNHIDTSKGPDCLVHPKPIDEIV